MICTAKVLSHQTLRCPVCQNQKQVEPGYAGYSIRFDCCKSWVVTGAFDVPTMEKNFMVMPAIKLTWTEIKPSVRPPRYGSDPQEWQVAAIRDCVSDGFIIVDEYGEEVRGGGYWLNKANAEQQLKLMVAEELEAREQHGPDTD